MTGSNIPTAEETGPNPVDTYRPQDIEKLGIRSATDLQQFIPQQAGGTVNLNIGNGGDGTIQFNLRGILPKETLILIDGKRVAYGSLGVAGFSGGPDINLIPFSMIDHVDILKDGASAVYGSDAIAGVVNFFLVHKFRGLEIGGTYGNTNMGASNEMGEWEAWIKAGTGDDKTDIVVIADFWQRLGGVFSRDRDISSNGNFNRFGGFDARSGNFPGRLGSQPFDPEHIFQCKHSDATLGAEQSDFSVLYQPCSVWYSRPHLITWEIRCPGMGITRRITSRLLRPRCLRETVKCTTARSCATYATST